jgi:isocitrate dehydrogenase
VHELDTRGSHFYLAKFWIAALAKSELSEEEVSKFKALTIELEDNIETILGEINATQGKPKELVGYYRFDFEKTEKAMRPSQTLNGLINQYLG